MNTDKKELGETHALRRLSPHKRLSVALYGQCEDLVHRELEGRYV